MKQVSKIVFWILITVFLIISFSFVSDRYFVLVCKNINVIILDSTENSFVSEKDIVDLLTKPGNTIIGKQMKSINTKYLEEQIEDQTSVEISEVFKTIDGSINVLIDQRNPLIRIFPKNGESYYIDVKGRFMPLSNKYASHLIIANGNIPGNINTNKYKDIYLYNNQTLIDLFELAKFFKKDEFWNSQIEQVYVKNNKDFELIPRVGSHEILLGDIYNIDKKLRNLKTVYKQGFSKESWIKYHYINLKYENQVICSKR